ncbi:MAG TPA: phosphoribosyltransferase family protein [Bacteroidia bacterium]|nr:phosphoribosyltransferase family protein [Bacteroidia bacterium]HNS11311.1 phosphoribosyltransferase family protein [Bacteroidia bacterium]
MNQNSTLLLDQKQIEQRIARLAYQIYEDNVEEKEIIIAGILTNGYLVAERLCKALKSIAGFSIKLIEIELDKKSQVDQEIKIELRKEELTGKVIILVDDVLNSGKTMMYALKPFLSADIKKIRTVVLVDRNHRRYPVAIDFSGLTLSTTMQDHVSVEFENDSATAVLT